MSIFFNPSRTRMPLIFVAVLCFCSLTRRAEAKQKPLLELGIGGIVSFLPDYPAAGQRHLNWIPFPVFIYRGSIFRSSVEEGLSGRVVNRSHFKFTLSFDGSFKVDSEKNIARQGMPNLDWLFEVGPMASFIFNPRSANQLDFRIPVRAVLSTSFKNVKYRGFLSEPGLTLTNYGFPCEDCYLAWSVCARLGDTRLNDYFYTVRPEFVTPTRPEYYGRSGYMGSDLNIYQRINIGSQGLFLSYTLSSHHRAVNRESPLFMRKWNQTFTVGLIIVFYSSSDGEKK